MNEIMTPDEVCDLLKVTRRHLYDLALRHNRLPAIRVSRKVIRFRRSEIERWMKNQR
jgi:excisionase family DNA binding protein